MLLTDYGVQTNYYVWNSSIKPLKLGEFAATDLNV